MPHYLGVSAYFVVNSLKRAEALLRQLDLGPETNKQLDDWLKGNPYKKITAARTDKDLAKTMLATGSRYVLICMSDIFQHHGALNIKGTGDKLYSDLSSWGAFSSRTPPSYSPVDEERDLYLIKQYASCALQQKDKAPVYLKTLINTLKPSNPSIDHAIAPLNKKLSQILNKAHKEKNSSDTLEKAVNTLFINNDAKNHHLMKLVLFGMSGLQPKFENYKVKTPFNSYGVALKNKPGNFMDMNKAIAPLKGRFISTLRPYYDTDEVQGTAIGAITEDNNQIGLIFNATSRVAQAVARAFPNENVIDKKGNKISGNTQSRRAHGPQHP